MGLFTKKESMSISIPDMSCGHCEAKVTAALKGVKDVTAMKIDLPGKKATLTINSGLNFEVVNEALSKAGYPAQLV